jgi:hypothetical protein
MKQNLGVLIMDIYGFTDFNQEYTVKIKLSL